jgi:hypothetical protein
MTEHQARLRALLERYEPALLATRPPSGDWSAIENVRHMLYAEQHHLGRFIRGGLGLSPVGLPQGGNRVSGPDTSATIGLAAVFAEWERVHASASARLDLTQPWLEVQLPRLLRHQIAHGRLAARALSQLTGQPVRLPRAP